MGTILIVDDHAESRYFLTTLLGYRGHRTAEATRGSEALAAARTEPPELFTPDRAIAAMGGFEFLRRLRAEAAIAHTPVIFYTAISDWHEVRVLVESAGIVRFLTR